LRNGQGKNYIYTLTVDSNKGWRKHWFYVPNIQELLPERSGNFPKWNTSWSSKPGQEEMDQIVDLLQMIAELKKAGLTGAAVFINFGRRLVQPIKDRTRPGYEYMGKKDPTREECWRPTDAEVVHQVNQYMIKRIGNKGCPKPFNLLHPPPEVRNLDRSVILCCFVFFV